MLYSKKEIDEIIDSNGDLIGIDDTPKSGSDLESQANGTTDHNIRIGTQPYSYDVMARFGFGLLPFFESIDNDKHNELISNICTILFNFKVSVLKSYTKKINKLKGDYRKFSESDFNSVSEKDQEDIIKYVKEIFINISKNDDLKIVDENIVDVNNVDGLVTFSKDKEIREKKLEKIAGLINKLPKKDVTNLVNLLERA